METRSRRFPHSPCSPLTPPRLQILSEVLALAHVCEILEMTHVIGCVGGGGVQCVRTAHGGPRGGRQHRW